MMISYLYVLGMHFSVNIFSLFLSILLCYAVFLWFTFVIADLKFGVFPLFSELRWLDKCDPFDFCSGYLSEKEDGGDVSASLLSSYWSLWPHCRCS